MNKAHKKLLVGLVMVVSLAGSGMFLYRGNQPVAIGSIREYVPRQDREFAIRNFNDHKWLLFISPDPNIEHIFDTHSPNTYDLQQAGKMKIKMFYDNNEPTGLVTYYMETSYQGRILFLVVDKKFQGKGYGRKLMLYAIDELQKMGAKTIKLFTRHENIPAQKLYNSLGFMVEGSDTYGIFYRKKL